MKRVVPNNQFISWTSRNGLCPLFILFIVCSLLPLPASEGHGQPIPLAAVSLQSSAPKTPKEIEYDVKAAFIYNFMKFIELPQKNEAGQGKEEDSPKTMTIGILGVNLFGSAFKPILDKEIQGRKIRLVEIPSYHQFYETSNRKSEAWNNYKARYQKIMNDCNVLFICDSETNHDKELLTLTAGHPILTISDVAEFAKKDGMIGFIKDDNKIRFEINLVAAEKEKIKIRSQLLTLAKAVYEKKK